jgi:hypothetical protein
LQPQWDVHRYIMNIECALELIHILATNTVVP